MYKSRVTANKITRNEDETRLKGQKNPLLSIQRCRLKGIKHVGASRSVWSVAYPATQHLEVVPDKRVIIMKQVRAYHNNQTIKEA